MKQFYVCERCGAQFDNWDDAYRCEHSHLSVEVINRCNLAEADDDLMEIVVNYNPGCPLPSTIAVMYQVVDPDTGELLSENGIPVFRSAVYFYASRQPSADLEKINASMFKRRQENEAHYEEWRRKREEATVKEEA